ncbi:MAG: hypothetical protein ABIQ55_03280 [Gemmatimonadaceae bacterium]
MGDFGLGPEVRRIIAANLATMDHVELLLLLYKAAPASRSLDEMVRDTRRPAQLIINAVADLGSGGLVSKAADPAGVDSYKYDPRSESLRSAVAEVVDVYNTRPVTLIRAIYDRPAQPVMSFAEAFRVRGDG